MSIQNNRHIKVFQRNRFFKNVGKRVSYLTLPGRDCHDIALALQKGIITPSSRITAVERNQQTHTQILKWFATNWPHARPGPIHAELAKVNGIEPVDLAFLDYMGNVTQLDAIWIREELATALLPKANVGITACAAYRNNRFIPEVIETLRTSFPNHLRDTERSLRNAHMPKEFLTFSAIYLILAECLFFPKHHFTFQPCIYRHESTTPNMFLFNIESLEEVGRSKLSRKQRQIEKALLEILPRYDGMSILANDIPLHPKPNKPIHRDEVARMLNAASTPLQRRKATQFLENFVNQEVAKGRSEDYARRWVKARQTYFRNTTTQNA